MNQTAQERTEALRAIDRVVHKARMPEAKAYFDQQRTKVTLSNDQWTRVEAKVRDADTIADTNPTGRVDLAIFEELYMEPLIEMDCD